LLDSLFSVAQSLGEFLSFAQEDDREFCGELAVRPTRVFRNVAVEYLIVATPMSIVLLFGFFQC
jgi:hypothetical protein